MPCPTEPKALCPAGRVGACPIPRGGGTCWDLCSFDEECPWGHKCCSNGCGCVCSGFLTVRRLRCRCHHQEAQRDIGPRGEAERATALGGPAQCHRGGSKSQLRAAALLWGLGTQRDVEQEGALLAMPRPHGAMTLAADSRPCSLRAPQTHPPLQMLRDGRAAAPWQEGAVVPGHWVATAPNWPVPFLPLPAIKLVLTISGCFHVSTLQAWPGAAPSTAPALPRRGTGWGSPLLVLGRTQGRGHCVTPWGAGARRCTMGTALPRRPWG